MRWDAWVKTEPRRGAQAHRIPRVDSIRDQRSVLVIDQVGSLKSKSRIDMILRMVITQTQERQCQSSSAKSNCDWRRTQIPPRIQYSGQTSSVSVIVSSTMGTGKQRTITSVSKLMIPAARYAAGRLAHRPPSIFGSQLNASGRQSSTSSRNTDTNQHT